MYPFLHRKRRLHRRCCNAIDQGGQHIWFVILLNLVEPGEKSVCTANVGLAQLLFIGNNDLVLCCVDFTLFSGSQSDCKADILNFFLVELSPLCLICMVEYCLTLRQTHLLWLDSLYAGFCSMLVRTRALRQGVTCLGETPMLWVKHYNKELNTSRGLYILVDHVYFNFYNN